MNQNNEEIPKMGKKLYVTIEVFEHLLKLNANALNISISLSPLFDNIYVESLEIGC